MRADLTVLALRQRKVVLEARLQTLIASEVAAFEVDVGIAVKGLAVHLTLFQAVGSNVSSSKVSDVRVDLDVHL